LSSKKGIQSLRITFKIQSFKERRKMKRKILIVSSVILIVTRLIYAFDDGDFQIWHTQSQELKISEKKKIELKEEFRFGDNAQDFYYHHYDVGFSHSLNKLDFKINYRQVYEKKKNKFREENRPHINAILKFNLGVFKLSNRHRLEYRYFDYKPDIWRYRNKFSIKFPSIKFTRLGIQPYLANEIFLNFQGKSFNQNRFYCGFDMRLTKKLKVELYYLLQSSRHKNKWKDTNILGTKMKLVF